MIPEIERKAVRALMPYFSKNPVVFDIGSNKGEWAETVIQNVESMFLFEPNQRLLTYTMVKFDYLTNVTYIPRAVFSEERTIDFFYFNNQNNGLSSVFYNQFWVDQGLPMQLGTTETITIDSLKTPTTIDFMKIDVEGADFDVLLGAKETLKKKLIRFAQIEYSDHYKLSGHSFAEVQPFIQQFDYDLFHFDGVNFTRVVNNPASYGAENFYIMDREFTQNWNREFIENTQGMKLDFVLEIGCFEGLTTAYICDNLLKPGGRIICVDPLTDEYLPGHPDNALFVGQYDRFIRNTKGLPVELIRTQSRHAFQKEGFQHYRFDLIYIDGDHTEEAVFNDGLSAFMVCRVGGYILFDDYEWREETKRGIDRFISVHAGQINIIKKGYQVLVQKTSN